MDRIISFEDFRKKASDIGEDDNNITQEGHDGQEKKHYMFFQNLASIKHYVDEILTMDPMRVDSVLQDGHDWAADHITSSKDDVQEVAEWLRNAMQDGHTEDPGTPSQETTPIPVEVENTDVKIETEEGEEDDEDEE